MCSNRSNLAFNRNNNNNQIKITTSVFPFNTNTTTTTNSNKSSSALEHVYYAKLVNFDRQRRLNKQNESDIECKNSNEIDLSQQRNRLRNVPSKIKNAEYESLVNLDSGIESKNKTNKISNNNINNKNEDSRSTSSCCSSSIEKITEDVELEDDDEEEFQVVEQSNLNNKINSLKLTSSNKNTNSSNNNNNNNKSIIKILEKRKYSNSTTTSTSSSSSAATTGSFSSSASSISSALSSIAINNHLSSSSSSTSSSSSSSPNFLSTKQSNNAILTDSSNSIYSSNYKTRSAKLKSNELTMYKREEVPTMETFKPRITTPPTKPSTPPPQLFKQQFLDTSQLNESIVNSNSTNSCNKTQTMSSWLQSSNFINSNNKQLNDSENSNSNLKQIKPESLMNRHNNAHFSNIDSSVGVVSTKENNKLLADKLLQYSRLNAQLTSTKTKSFVKLINEVNNEKIKENNHQNVDDNNLYCDLNEFNNQNKNVETINNNNTSSVIFRDNCYYVNRTNDYANNPNNKREFYVLNDKNEILSQEEQVEEQEENEEELNDEETTATEELIDSKQETTQLSSATSTRNYYYDSTLLTPLKPITSSETKLITSNSNNSNEAKRVSIKTNKKITTTNTTTTCANSNIKSASTSYLLSKITSIASLTLPKHARTATTTTPVDSLLNNSTTFNQNNNNPTSPATSTTSSSSSTTANPLSNLANKTQKLFTRKLDEMSQTNSSLHQSTSPYLVFTNNENTTAQHLNMSPSALMNKFSSSVSSSSSSSYLCNNNQPIPQPTITSRRPFKKRSQSTHNNVLNKITWYYNQNDDCWYKTQALVDSNQSSPKTSFSSTLKKRKSLNNKIASVVGTKSMSSFLNNNNDTIDDLTNQSISPSSLSFTDSFAPPTTRIRLTHINLKHLTLVELKYLKQICFNKLQKQFQSLQVEQQKLRKQQLNKSTASSNQTNTSSSNTNIFSIRFAIPKDESIKTTKTKSIGIRSKSVDFKFFDEFKENYLSKKSSKDANQQQMFGQSLYKCILNDLEQSSRFNMSSSSSSNVYKTGIKALAAIKSCDPTSKVNSNNILKNSTKIKWRSSNQNNILIASKFDLNLLNELNTNDNLNQINYNNVNNVDLANSKRNSVLFEALDLKNMSSRCMLPEPQNKKIELRSNSIVANLLPPVNENQTKKEELQMIANNQNLSIRSEGLVPNIVKSCCNHISEYGLDVVGIFRIDSSKKRIKEIKEMYDTGKEVHLNESFNPNDSACILKEYLRSLPEPLLTRDLYSSFLSTCKIKDAEKRLQAVKYLICLLPVPNRDTLECLLNLLDKVKENANKQDETDKQKGGNRMDAFNLAMVFGPNILKKHKLGSSSSSSKVNDFATDKYNLIDDIDSVISVTKYLIENHNALFYIEANLHNELIQTINNLNPSELNAILTRKLISSIGLSKLDGLNGNTSDTSGYSSSVKSNNVLVAKSSTDESLSPLNCFSSSETNNQYMSGDFIDYKMSKHRTSRTKLHKIADNLNPNLQHVSKEFEPICFVNSPSHSPIRSQPPQHQHHQLKHYKRNTTISKSSFSNEIYNNHVVESYMNPHRNNSVSSSLLLMIQSNEKTNQSKLAKHNKLNQHEELLTKATKSLSNLNQQHQANLIDKRRQSSGVSNSANSSTATTLTTSIASKPPQYKLVNSNTIQICSKFYDKTKYNIIGEQETLV